MRAVKGNREYTIDESQQKFYQDSGFDILDSDSNVIAYGRGKTVPYEDHMAAVKEIENLREIIAELKSAVETEGEAESEKETPKKAGTKKAGE